MDRTLTRRLTRSGPSPFGRCPPGRPGVARAGLSTLVAALLCGLVAAAAPKAPALREGRAARARPVPDPTALTEEDTPQPDEPYPYTHTLRVGPSYAFVEGLNASSGGPSFAFAFLPARASGWGARVDYILRGGKDAVHWHSVASFALHAAQLEGEGRYEQDGNPGRSEVRTYAEEGLYFCGFLGTGVQIDLSPPRPGAWFVELDGTVGVGSGGSGWHLGLVGAHVGLGWRLGEQWQVLASLEGEYSLIMGKASAALLLGRTF